MDKEKTGEYIRNLRKNKGWTQMQLAEQLHISDKAVSKWERGISFPDIELMEELAQVFQVDVADIIRGEEAGRAEHTVNELVKDTIDIAKREKKRLLQRKKQRKQRPLPPLIPLPKRKKQNPKEARMKAG